MNHLYGHMNIEKLASRYEREGCQFPLLNTGQIDESRLRDQVRVLLRNDVPSTLIGDIFSLPIRQCHGSYLSPNAPTYGFSCDHSVVNPSMADFTVNGPLSLKPSMQPNGWCPTQEHPKIPVLPFKQRPKVDISLLRKQHRLVQLSHAAICTNDEEKDGPCRKSRHCEKLKKLWSHLSVCCNDKCKMQHCFSSRYVLGHYCRCKDGKCVICEPARSQATKYQETRLLTNSDLPFTKIVTTTISESDNLTKDSTNELHLPGEDTDSHDPSKYLGEGNSIYITYLKAFASNDVAGNTSFSTKRHSLSSVSVLSPTNGDKSAHFEPNDALDVAYFLSRLKKQDT